MEYDESKSESERVEFFVFVLFNAFLAVVLAAALAVGGRDLMAISAEPVLDRVSNITSP